MSPARVMPPQEIRARLRKVAAVENMIDRRLRGEGLDPGDRAAALRIVDQLTAATPEQWASLAADAGINALSEISQKLLIDVYRDRARRVESDEELFGELLRQRRDLPIEEKLLNEREED